MEHRHSTECTALLPLLRSYFPSGIACSTKIKGIASNTVLRHPRYDAYRRSTSQGMYTQLAIYCVLLGIDRLYQHFKGHTQFIFYNCVDFCTQFIFYNCVDFWAAWMALLMLVCPRSVPHSPIRCELGINQSIKEWHKLGLCSSWVFQWPLLLTWLNFNPSMDK